MRYTFSIPVKAVAKQSFRAVAVKKGKIHGFTPEAVNSNKDVIRRYVVAQLPKPYKMLVNQVVIQKLHFIFHRPESLKRLVTEHGNEFLLKNTRPDIDNLMKQVLDSIKGIVINDDNIISRIKDVGKFYGEEDMIILELEGE